MNHLLPSPGTLVEVTVGHAYEGRKGIVRESGKLHSEIQGDFTGLIVDVGLAGLICLRMGQFAVIASTEPKPSDAELTTQVVGTPIPNPGRTTVARVNGKEVEYFNGTGLSDFEVDAAIARGAVVVFGNSMAALEDVLPNDRPHDVAVHLRGGALDDRFIDFAKAAESSKRAALGAKNDVANQLAFARFDRAGNALALCVLHAESARFDALQACGHGHVNARHGGRTSARNQIDMAAVHAEEARSAMIDAAKLLNMATRTR